MLRAGVRLGAGVDVLRVKRKASASLNQTDRAGAREQRDDAGSRDEADVVFTPFSSLRIHSMYAGVQLSATIALTLPLQPSLR